MYYAELGDCFLAVGVTVDNMRIFKQWAAVSAAEGLVIRFGWVVNTYLRLHTDYWLTDTSVECSRPMRCLPRRKKTRQHWRRIIKTKALFTERYGDNAMMINKAASTCMCVCVSIFGWICCGASASINTDVASIALDMPTQGNDIHFNLLYPASAAAAASRLWQQRCCSVRQTSLLMGSL